MEMERHIHPLHTVEILEARIAPAGVTILNAHTAIYDDFDGDHVKITVSSGTLTLANFTSVGSGAGIQLQTLDLHTGGFDGANITFSVVRAASGDGLANIGYINSTGHDLGAVVVKGDLGRIDVGANDDHPGIKFLSARSMGRLGTDTQAPGGTLESNINGDLDALSIKTDLVGARINCLTGNIGPVNIGGSMIGGTAVGSGSIFTDGSIGPIRIGHDIRGGTGAASGFISTIANIASVAVGGSFIGGDGAGSGGINAFLGHIGNVTIRHDVIGNVGEDSGVITGGGIGNLFVGGSIVGGSSPHAGGVHSGLAIGNIQIGHDLQGGSALDTGNIIGHSPIGNIVIGGSVVGGPNSSTGEIMTSGNIGMIKIGHDLVGGSVSGTASSDGTGFIQSSAGRIAGITIGGSIVSGIDGGAGSLTSNASIRAGNDIGSLTVKGSIIGHPDTGTGASPVVISARGQEFPQPGIDLAIGKIAIAGNIENAQILAGYDITLAPKNADAQIGAVKTGADWVASDLVAGATNSVFPNFGSGDFRIGGAGTTDNSSIISKIASITIGGLVVGTPNSVSATDHFGFVAQQIGSFKATGFTVPLRSDNFGVGGTADVSIHEI